MKCSPKTPAPPTSAAKRAPLRRSFWLLLLLSTCLALPALTSDQPKELSPEKRSQLLDLLGQDCGSCHGLTLKGGLGPSLKPDRVARLGVAGLREIILGGISHTAMPAWRGQLSPLEAEWIAHQLLSGIPEPVFKTEDPRQALAGARGTGDLGVIVERATGSVQIVETTQRTSLGSIGGLGDLSHASLVFSRDARYAFIFGRDGGLSKIDLLSRRIVRRIIQAGNSIGGAISADGRFVAVSNYTPGGVRIFDSQSLELVGDIPAGEPGENVKVVGLVEAPNHGFVYSLFEKGALHYLQFKGRDQWHEQKYNQIGSLPYDGVITPNGRFYLAGLFGENGMAVLDLWHPDRGVHRILTDRGRDEREMPVYKMPHLEGWAMTGREAFLPAVGKAEILVLALDSWEVTETIPTAGQPVFVVGRPDERQLWVNFAYPNNDTVQVVDIPSRKIVKTLKPGKGVMHMEFTPKGEHIWVSVRDQNRIDIYDSHSLEVLSSLPAEKPSGIFFTHRAGQLGK